MTNTSIRLYTAEQVRRLDESAIDAHAIPGIELMERAGRSVFDSARMAFPDAGHWLVLCGGGNNGGDGYIVARLAKEAGVQVRWVLADVLALPEMGTFDFLFDRGCYHNVRYVDAAGFVASLRRLSRPGTRCLILSLDRDSPPGVREQTMRDDLEPFYEFQWLRDSGVEDRDGKLRRESWSLMMRRREEPASP